MITPNRLNLIHPPNKQFTNAWSRRMKRLQTNPTNGHFENYTAAPHNLLIKTYMELESRTRPPPPSPHHLTDQLTSPLHRPPHRLPPLRPPHRPSPHRPPHHPITSPPHRLPSRPPLHRQPHRPPPHRPPYHGEPFGGEEIKSLDAPGTYSNGPSVWQAFCG